MIFDQYSRYAALVRLLRHIGSHGATILDVGSGPECLLGAMVEEASVTYLDPLITSRNDESHVAGDIHSPILLQRSFEIVCAVDVLEHVIPDDRDEFLKRLSSLATKGLVIGFPTSDSAYSSEVDAVVNDAYKHVYGSDYPWLAEHFSNGLPSAASTCDRLKQLGWHCQIIGHGYVPWLKDLLSEVVCYWDIPALQPLVLDASDAFNMDLADHDFMPPHYRTFILASRSSLQPYRAKGIPEAKRKMLMNRFREILESMKGKFATGSLSLLKSQQHELLDVSTRLREVSDWGVNSSADLASRDELVLQLSARNNELATWISNLTQNLSDRDEQLRLLMEKADELASWGNGLCSQMAERDARVRELSDRLEEASAWGTKLFAEAVQKDQSIAVLSRKVEEASSWGIKASSEVAQRDALISDLNRKLEDMSLWSGKMSSEVAERDGRIEQLTRKVDEISTWGSRLSLDLAERDVRIAELHRKVEEMSSWGTTLTSTLAERDSLIGELNLKIQEVSSWGSKLSSTLGERDELIAELMRKIEGTSHRQSGIGSS
jgi:hypothetical protein